ncbi:hypothetical protein [Streptomyces sp. S3(2020)]|uniref:hypothetical protein n=1 Tax=Streptomyces sp. S3(2020) TaxID=2732044 RepID=UPI0019CF9FBF|nr:hypothetical protein [Streptomyces sp. S3(2020)]
MTALVRRPTEHAALAAACRSPRRLPSVPALMAALLDAHGRGDREGATLAAHRVVRAAGPEEIPMSVTTAAAAALARQRQRLAPVGSNERRAAGVAAVLLDSARTHAGARRLLAQHRVPEDVHAAVLALLDELATPREGDDAPSSGVVARPDGP